MASTKAEIAQEVPPFLRIYKNGVIERLMGTDVVPPSSSSSDSDTINVQSKDVLYLPEHNLSSRLYLPKNINANQKLPLLVYYHGGGFVIETPFSPKYHTFCNNLASEAKILIVSVDYRRAPEHRLPAAYEDSWSVLKWVASHYSRDGPEDWINGHADLSKVFLAGDSAGANIAHYIAMKSGEEKNEIEEIKVVGTVLIHPFFWGKEAVGSETKEVGFRSMVDKLWLFACPESSGCDDPWINPGTDMKLGGLVGKKVIVFVAEKDLLKDRGWFYCESLKKSGWNGEVEYIEDKDENHVFHLFNPEKEKAKSMLRKIGAFINGDKEA